ncbi:MAG: hypothetical protein OER43_07675 [Gammaproteobacteria bacterium]|nr:hypothetical protein [Gammaproteobacteria bacterium]
METYGTLFNEAKNSAHKPGSKLGSKTRDGAETMNALAKAGVALVLVLAAATSGHVIGFVRGVWDGVTACPKA